MFQRNSRLTQPLIPDSDHDGEKKLIAKQLKTLSQTKKTLICELQSLENAIKKLETLFNKLQEDFKRIDALDFKKVKELEIKNHYREFIKMHPTYAQMLQDLADLLVDLYMNRFINPMLSFGKKLNSFSHFSNKQALISIMTETGYQFEIWSKVEIPKEDFLKQTYKQKLEVVISAVDSQLSKQYLEVVQKRSDANELNRQIERLKPDSERSKFLSI